MTCESSGYFSKNEAAISLNFKLLLWKNSRNMDLAQYFAIERVKAIPSLTIKNHLDKAIIIIVFFSKLNYLKSVFFC